MRLVVSMLIGLALLLAPVAGVGKAAAHSSAANSTHCSDKPCGCGDDEAALQVSCAAMCVSQVAPSEAKLTAPATPGSRLADRPQPMPRQALSAPSLRPPSV